MNSVAAKTAVFLGLLSTAVFAQDLGKGHFELRASGGINESSSPTGSPFPSYQIGAAFSLSRFFALTADYTRDYLRRTEIPDCTGEVVEPGRVIVIPCINDEFRNRINEFMGGFRFSVPNRSPITPHLQFSLGAVRQTTEPYSTNTTASIYNPFIGSTLTEFAFAPGAGIDYKISHHFGIGIDANLVKANRMTGFYHVMGGVFFRF